MLDPDLSGQVALVTGSARGVGRALLLGLADRGADVGVHYHTSADAAAEVASVAGGRDVDATVVDGDVTDPDAVTDIFDAVERDLGPVDVLVNNVGPFEPSHWADIPWDQWRTVVESNFYGTVLCSRRVLPAMRDRGWGRIVNIGYASAEKGLVNPKNFPYFAAKAAVLMFTRMLAADTQDDGITVNAVSPYVVENSEFFPEDLPRDRPADFDDVLQAVLFFLGDDSGYISGENLEVDGGWLPETV